MERRRRLSESYFMCCESRMRVAGCSGDLSVVEDELAADVVSASLLDQLTQECSARISLCRPFLLSPPSSKGAADRARPAWRLRCRPKFPVVSYFYGRAAFAATAPASGAALISSVLIRPITAARASRLFPTSHAVLPPRTLANSSTHRLVAGPTPVLCSSADDLPNKTRPPKKCDGYQTHADTVPTKPVHVPCARCRRQMDEWTRSGDG